jgi:hypothetical protein
MSPFLYFIGVGASVTVNNTVNSFLDRLWWMSDVDPKRGCFLWVGTRGRGGYGPPRAEAPVPRAGKYPP